MRNKPTEVKHICGHSTYFYRNDEAFREWAKEAQKRPCGDLRCKTPTMNEFLGTSINYSDNTTNKVS